MMSKNMPRATAEEKRRMDLFRVTGCMLTWLKFGKKVPAECHHIVMFGKRYGHAYTIPLSSWYHRGIPEAGRTEDEMRAEYGASITDGRKSFVASHHYTELELWQKFQVNMGFDDALPTTKVLPRRLPHVDALRSSGQPADPTGVLASEDRVDLRAADARVGESRSRLVGPVGTAADVPVGVPATRMGRGQGS